MLDCQLIELVQFEPQPGSSRAVELGGADQQRAEAVNGALQRDRQQLVTIALGLGNHTHHDQLVANREVILQRLAETGDFAWSLAEHDGLVDKVFFQLVADEMHVRPQQFQHLQAGFRGDAQLVEFDQRLVKLARGFAYVGFRQAGEPAGYAAHAGVAEGQGLPGGRWYAQQQMMALSIQTVGSAAVRT